MRLKNHVGFRLVLVGALFALVFPVTAVAPASAQEPDEAQAVLVGAITPEAPGDGGSIRVDAVDGFEAEGGIVVIDPGTDSEETMTYDGVDPVSNELVGVTRPGALPHEDGALVTTTSTTSDDRVSTYLAVYKGTELDLPDSGTTTTLGTTTGFLKTFDMYGNLISTSTPGPSETTGSGSSSRFNCLHDRERTGFTPLQVRDRSVNRYEYVYQFLYYPYRQRNARTINGVSQLQWLICANGGSDTQNGYRALVTGPGVAFKNSSTTRKIKQTWKEGQTQSNTSISLGFEVGSGPVTVTGSITQNPVHVLKGSIVGPYASDFDQYSRNAAAGWWDTNCGWLCTRASGSSDFQGSAAEALWEFPMPTSSRTYTFILGRWLEYHCSNIFGC